MSADGRLIAYVDAQAGVAGDMLVGALIGLGLAPSFFEDVAAGLGLEGVRVEAEEVFRAGVTGWHVEVRASGAPEPARHLPHILAAIERAPLTERARGWAVSTFQLLARAEAEVHGVTPEDVHFHEVGAVDAIVEIAGVCAGLDALGVARIEASPLPLATGTVTFSHGTHALPAPAVAVLAAGVPCYGVDWGVETVTPTGIALLRTLADSFGPLPAMLVRGHGRGAGQRRGGVRLFNSCRGDGDESAWHRCPVGTQGDRGTNQGRTRSQGRSRRVEGAYPFRIPHQRRRPTRGRPGTDEDDSGGQAKSPSQWNVIPKAGQAVRPIRWHGSQALQYRPPDAAQ